MTTRSENRKNLTPSSTLKLEEFFSTRCKDEVFAVLDMFPEEKSVVVDYNELEMFDPDSADLLIEKPDETLEAATKSIVNIDPQRKNAKLNVRFKNVRNNIPLRFLRSEFIGKFIAVDGIVRKTDEIHPRIMSAVFECRSCMRMHEVEQKSNIIHEPAVCQECGGRSFRLVQDESRYMDTQTVKLQEPLENLSGGDQPRQINIILEDDLVDTLAPGDKVRITGTLKTQRDERTKRFNNFIYGNYIEPLEQEFEELHIDEEDEEKIIELAKSPDIYQKIIESTAPSIRGYFEVKEAIAFQLFGGTAKVLEDKTHIRGDMHILIVGDPGIGKSQILKYVSKLAPRGIYTSGKGTSGVGLTAAAVRDDLGGWSLEAGALVLGDKGNVCVDELDKMREEDRSAIHEALEQQTISIAKAGIMATLNSRCSVLAAANPKFGRFDRYKSIAEQIDLPSPILSRFDLIFIIEDKPNAERDHDLAGHILKIHQDSTIPYVIEPELMRKYIAYARKSVQPTLTKEAAEVLQDFYVTMRSGAIDEESPVPITARQLEALVRLAEASARIRLSNEVLKEDAQRAIKLQEDCMKQVGYDPDTGKVDIDKVEGRTSKSERDKINIIIDVIKELSDEYEGSAPKNIVYAELADKYNVGEEKVDEVINMLKSKGVIYEPTSDHYKVA
ncbi:MULTISPECIES: minichromosome maintenance protein MCM [Methanosphaera]|jgi:replicative DNA helicase Mcm|uniref:DNA helicase n=2 Tax=Methanosphaera stadtmanae TaxID=2317 RepID=Q2NHD8_METST|nr:MULTISPECIES: minichromosome maintenance protein MCM [Methanosphaera]ABC56765.1 predicted minichromosome maintenance protein [Methanosphaera stadtmanae DSM 3091]MDO5821692.1 minichromosome maintenance protein MCM [Methanosphaera sp.]MEE0489828.1 minichromosome maintenance protein MCM [Methanosphaera stadtmanae]OEC85138.1 AAA family ATPase [Methanosphaera sp. A6]RAP03533.1 AAA family ATPase [Methanosphaera stadtmanae]